MRKANSLSSIDLCKQAFRCLHWFAVYFLEVFSIFLKEKGLFAVVFSSIFSRLLSSGACAVFDLGWALPKGTVLVRELGVVLPGAVYWCMVIRFIRESRASASAYPTQRVYWCWFDWRPVG